jgi:hypothetical protein
MDTSKGSIIGNLLADLENQQRERGVSARHFPETYEEYKALPLEERLHLAKDMMAQYANITHAELDGQKSVAVTFKTEDPSVNLEAKVGFFDVSPKRERPNQPGQHTPAHLKIGVKAINVRGGLASRFDTLGKIEFDENPHVPIMARPWSPRSDDKPIILSEPLSEPEAIDMVDIVDAAVKKLIEGTIAGDRRFIGETALSGASES